MSLFSQGHEIVESFNVSDNIWNIRHRCFLWQAVTIIIMACFESTVRYVNSMFMIMFTIFMFNVWGDALTTCMLSAKLQIHRIQKNGKYSNKMWLINRIIYHICTQTDNNIIRMTTEFRKKWKEEYTKLCLKSCIVKPSHNISPDILELTNWCRFPRQIQAFYLGYMINS